MSSESQAPIDIQPYEDLANTATTKDEIMLIRESLMEDNGGNVNVITVNPETGDQTIVPVARIGAQTLAAINEKVLREKLDPKKIDVNSETWITEKH